jgi:hypothetical protein
MAFSILAEAIGAVPVEDSAVKSVQAPVKAAPMSFSQMQNRKS